ncbi:MAG TPA: hypothetical protein VG755_29895 [Nannocystaceae bacterium]|nr:hypothetical protein [Nannocystaceae bacterium]
MQRAPRPFSLLTGCVIGAAGAASAMTVVIARLMFVAPQCDRVDAATEAAEVAGLAAFEQARAAYDDRVARELVGEFDAANAELAWVDVRDRYRLFLAYPEAVTRWPQLAEHARDREAKLDELVANLVELQRLEIEAMQLAEAEAAMASARAQTERAHAKLNRYPMMRRSKIVNDGPDCTWGMP